MALLRALGGRPRRDVLGRRVAGVLGTAGRVAGEEGKTVPLRPVPRHRAAGAAGLPERSTTRRPASPERGSFETTNREVEAAEAEFIGIPVVKFVGMILPTRPVPKRPGMLLQLRGSFCLSQTPLRSMFGAPPRAPTGTGPFLPGGGGDPSSPRPRCQRTPAVPGRAAALARCDA